MSTPYLSEIKIMGFGFAPRGWAQCNGQLLPINQNQALFQLIGTTYGGDGQANFALPNMQGMVPIHEGDGHPLGQQAGSTSMLLDVTQLPAHQHVVQGTNAAATTDDASNNVLAEAGQNLYAPFSSPQAMGAATISNTGGGYGHVNVMPYLVLNYCIALQGIPPSRS